MSTYIIPQIKQLDVGFRGSVDSLILAHGVKLSENMTVLDVGSGVGTASIHAAYGVHNVKVTAIDIDKQACDLAIANYKHNNISADVYCANFVDFQFNGARFDYVITNPPFYRATEGRISPFRGQASHETIPLKLWVQLCLKRVKPHGIFVIIQTVDRLAEILSEINDSRWGITVTPITFRANQLPKRILIAAENGSHKKLTLNNAEIWDSLHRHDG